MNCNFINDDFLLESPLACRLYHGHVKGLPIVDYHNHLVPSELASDRRFDDIGQLWVVTDPYKHRAMRLHGEQEEVITGSASSREKFEAWSRTLPYTLGNPLFHWSAMEMKNVFGMDEMPDPSCADRLWDACNARLADSEFSTMGILRGFGVEVLSTSDDLLDDVTVHSSVNGDISVTPSLRADSILGFNQAWLEKLGSPKSLEEFLGLVSERLDVFAQNGCRVADHALDDGWSFACSRLAEAESSFARGEYQNLALKSYVLGWLASQYAHRGWTMLLHVGAQRFTNSRLRAIVGPAGGYASIGNTCDVRSLCAFLDSQDLKDELPKTVLFTLNPADNAVLATLTGSYAREGVYGKVQFGPAWWYNDHFLGMTDHLENLSAYSLMPQFIGMTTDSRNVLSFSRHDYFRRILCNWLAEKVRCGQFPSDEMYLGKIAADISYYNAKKYFYE